MKKILAFIMGIVMMFSFSLVVFAEAEGTAAVGEEVTQPSFWEQYSFLILLVVMIIVFYFFVIRPQKKQEKEVASMRNALEVGDEITTIGGIIGEIISIKDETVVIETSGAKTKMRVLKSAIKNVDVKASEK